MLSQEAENNIAEYIADRINDLNAKILQRIGENIDIISKLSPSDAYRVGQLLKYGGSYNELLKEISRISGLSIEDVNSIFERIAIENKDFAQQFYRYRYMDFVPYERDFALQRQVKSIGELTNQLFMNISNTHTIGYVFEDLNGNRTFHNIQETYQKLIDESIIAVTQGKETFASTMKNTLETLGGSGLVEYESGHTRRLDSAVRMNILDGIRQLNMENSKQFGAEYGADGVEISVHENPAPDHEDIQGRQFKQEEFDKLEAGEEAYDVNGIKYDGQDKRQIGHYNCYHKTFAIIVGVSEPEYTDEQLKEIQQRNTDGFEYEGKHYTMYEGTQLQRRIETEIRRQKDKVILAKASGDAGKEIAEKSQKKIDILANKYNKLCQVSGLPTKLERTRVINYRRTKI